jgi:hypothetical protein
MVEALRVEEVGVVEEAEVSHEVGANLMDSEVLKKMRMIPQATPLREDLDVDLHHPQIQKIMKMKVPHPQFKVGVGVEDIETKTMLDTQVHFLNHFSLLEN